MSHFNFKYFCYNFIITRQNMNCRSKKTKTVSMISLSLKVLLSNCRNAFRFVSTADASSQKYCSFTMSESYDFNYRNIITPAPHPESSSRRSPAQIRLCRYCCVRLHSPPVSVPPPPHRASRRPQRPAGKAGSASRTGSAGL